VVAYLVDHVDHVVWGYLVANDLGLHHGTIYPILERLPPSGWTTSRDESPAEWAHRAAPRGGQRRRRYYRLTSQGIRAAGLVAAR